MRRQTILFAAALGLTSPGAGLTENRNAAQDAGPAIARPETSAAARVILRTEDAKAPSSSMAPVDEATLLFELAEAHKRRRVAPPLPSSGADAAEPRGFTAHRALAPADGFVEDRERVSLKLGPLLAPGHRAGDGQAQRAGDGGRGVDVEGVAVGLSFKLN